MPVVARRSEDVHAVGEAQPRGPGPPALEGLLESHAFCNGCAGYRRVSKSREAGAAALPSPQGLLRVSAGPAAAGCPEVLMGNLDAWSDVITIYHMV